VGRSPLVATLDAHTMAATADLLAIDAKTAAAKVGAIAADAEKAYVDALSDDQLFDTLASMQAELEKAMAAMQRKRVPDNLTTTDGPRSCYEGTPIDCGAVADAAIAGFFASLTTAELEEMTKQTEADLAAAKAALAKKQAASSASSSGAASTPTKSSAAPARTASSPLLERAASALSPVVAKADEMLEDAAAKAGVPKTTLGATLVAGAVAGAAVLFGAFFGKKK